MGLVGYRYRALVVLYPNSRIANLFYFLSGFRREHSIRKQVEHPMVFCGQVPRRGWQHFCFERGWQHFLVSKLTLYDCVWMRCTNKYKASAEVWSAVLLSREGSSQRQTKCKKEVNVDLLNNYHLVVLNIRTQQPCHVLQPAAASSHPPACTWVYSPPLQQHFQISYNTLGNFSKHYFSSLLLPVS